MLYAKNDKRLELKEKMYMKQTLNFYICTLFWILVLEKRTYVLKWEPWNKTVHGYGFFW